MAAAVALASATAYAQPAERDHRRPPPPPPPGPVERDHRGPGIGVVINATVAPPEPQAENPGTKAGFEWVPGKWDWREGKWQWSNGHWERERAGKHWRRGRWEQKSGGWVYLDGEWIDANAVPPPPPPGPPGAPPPPVGAPPPPGAPPMPPGGHEHHRDWKIESDRPVVSSYWPTKGKPGRKVVIRGENFPADAMVMWGGTQIAGAKVTPNEIVFQVPATATTGEIFIKRSHGRPLPVGQFEVAASYDPEAEAKRMEDERRKAAEAAWATREKELAKDRNARETAWKKKWQEMDANREDRRRRHEDEYRAKWEAAFLSDGDTQAELTIHAQRIADLGRAAAIAEVNANGKLAVRIQVAQQRENDRHDQRMAALKAGFSAKGGTP
jgi:hypothetical protein